MNSKKSELSFIIIIVIVIFFIADVILGVMIVQKKSGTSKQVQEAAEEEAPATAEEAPAAEEEAPAAEEAAPVKEAETPATSSELIKVGFAQVGHESDWRVANTQNYQDTFSEANGYELLFTDCYNDHAVQMETVRGFIEQEVDYIFLPPIQAAGWDDVLKEAQDAGIPVLIVDRDVEADPSLYTTQLGYDMVAEGEMAGNWLAEYLGDKDARILVIEGYVGAFATLGRTEGFNNIVAQHDNWEVLDSQSGDFTQAGGQEVMESYIKSYKDFNVVVCQNDNEAYGAMDAMNAAGITYGVDGDVTIISFDATHDGLQYTLDGKITCNVECNPLQADLAAELIRKLEAGEEVDKKTFIKDKAFVAPGIESQYAITMTQEILDGRTY